MSSRKFKLAHLKAAWVGARRREPHVHFGALQARDFIRPLAQRTSGRRQLEEWFEREVGGTAFAFSSCRSALWNVLRAAGIGPGDDVVVPGFTCIAVPEAVLYTGAWPVYADLAPGAVNCGLDEIEAVVTDRTRAVVIQHTFGVPADAGRIVSWARERGLLTIEDCALALGSRHGGRQIGSDGDAAVFSFELSKTVTCGWGGVAVVGSTLAEAMAAQSGAQKEMSPLRTVREVTQLAAAIQLYRPRVFGVGKFALAAAYRSRLFRVSTRPLEQAPPPGWSRRLSPFLASLAFEQIHRLEAIRSASMRAATAYENVLRARDVAPLVHLSEGLHLVRYPVSVQDPRSAAGRFSEAGIDVGRWFDAPVSPMPPDPGEVGYQPGSCPSAEALSEAIINLPTHPRLTASDIDRVGQVLDSVLLAG